MASSIGVLTVQKATQAQAATSDNDLIRLGEARALLNSVFQGQWSNAVTYNEGQQVGRNGASYISNVDSNLNNDPATSPSQWRLAIPAAQSAYVYVAWASDASGTGFTTTFDASKPYIAFLNSTTPIGSPNAGNFAGLWKNYQGATGNTGNTGNNGTNGADGASAYVYIAYASDGTGTGFTTTFNVNLNFIAIKNTTSPIASPSVSDFTGLWKQYGTPALSATSPITYSSGAIGINASSGNTANYVVQRDASGNFACGQITLATGNLANHLTMGGQTLGFNTDAFYFSQPISVPTKIKIGTSHELRNTSNEVQLYSNGAAANVFQTSGSKLVVAALQLSGLTGVLQADGSGNITASANSDAVPEGATNLYYTSARVNTAADARITLQKGVANGLASLDSGGKLASSQIPSSLLGALDYQGTWNANTNTPALVSSTGTKGFYYMVTTAGSTNLDGITDWQVGDWAVFDGTIWEKVDNTDAVVSVNGHTGTVTLTTSDISEGSNLYFTNARAIAAPLTGLSTASGGAITASDTILIAFGRTQFRLAAIEAWTTSNVTEGTNLYYTDARVKTVAAAGLNSVIVSPAASTSGSPNLFTVTGPTHTGLAAGVEASDVWHNLNRIVTFSTGSLTTQRAVRIDAPSYAFSGASTLSNASTVAISGAPIAWSNATITNAAALRIYPGAVAVANTNAFGLWVDAPTSGTNNYCAVFPTGKVGIGTSSPATPLHVVGNAAVMSGNLGIGTTSPSVLLHVSGSIIRVDTAHTPASSSETGDAGQICWDASYIYVWTAANTVKRAALATF